MSVKPRRVFDQALGRMVPIGQGPGAVEAADVPSPVGAPKTVRMTAPRTVKRARVYEDASDPDRISITQRVVEHPIVRASAADKGRDLYAELLDSIYDSVVITAMDGRIVEANARAAQKFGYDRQVLKTMSVVDLISGADQRVVEVLRDNVSGGHYTILEAVCVTVDGQRFDAEIPVGEKHANGVTLGLCFFIRDISERRRVEQDLAAAGEKLVEAERVQVRLDTLSTLYHEINNPLQILLCMAEVDANKEYKSQLARILTVLEQLRTEAALAPVVDEQGGSRYQLPTEERVDPGDCHKILVVDDEAALRGMFAQALSSGLPGVTIDLAGDGAEAARLFEDKYHGIVVMDLSMPGMDGVDAFREMERICERKRREMPRCIFCTGFYITDAVRDIVGDGARHACLRKPLSLNDLVAAVAGCQLERPTLNVEC